MGFVEWIEGDQQSETKSRAVSYSDVFGASTSDAAALDYIREGYQENPYIYRAVNLVSSAVAELDIDVYTDEGAGREKVTDHPASELINRPNPLRGKRSFIERFVTLLLLNGHGFIEGVGPAPDDAPRELYAPQPRRIDPIVDRMADSMIQGFRDDEASAQWSTDEMHMVRLVNPDNQFKGQSLVRAAAGAGDVNNFARRYSRALLKASGVPPYFVGIEAEISVEREKDMELDWMDQVESSFDRMLREGRTEPNVMGNAQNVSIEQIGLSPQEMQLLPLEQQSAREIAVAMGPAPELLGDPENKVYNNVAQAREALYTETAIPLAKMIASELDHWLRPQFSAPEGDLAFGIDPNVPALQSDPEAEREQDLAELQAGAITINEYRERRGMEPLENGDVALVPQNRVPLAGPASIADEPTESG